MHAGAEETYLIDRARKGSVDAFELLVTRYAPVAYRVAMRLTNNDRDAQNITQEALVALWRALPEPGGNASFLTLLYRAVTRRATTGHDGTRRGRTVERPGALDDVDDSTGAAHQQRAVNAAIAALPPAQSVAFVLHHCEGLPYDQVASITQTSVPVVRSHLFRARRALATSLARPEVTT